MKRAEIVFLILALLVGLPLVFLTPPFQAPDESDHFFRAYGISELRFVPLHFAGSNGDFLPAGVQEVASRFRHLAQHSETTTSAQAIRDARNIRLQKNREMVWFPFSALQLPVSYAPQSAAIALGRLVTDRPLDLMYWARLANFLLATALTAAAIRLAPCFQWTILLLALMPMTAFLRSSASPDTTLIALAFVIFSMVLRFRMTRNEVDLSSIAMVGVLISLMKPYGLLAFLPLGKPTIWRNWRLRGRALLVIVGVLAAGAVVAQHFREFQFETPWKANPAHQLPLVMDKPLGFVHLASRSLATDAMRLGEEFVGKLGWLNTPLPLWLLISYGAVLILVALFDGSREDAFSVADRFYFCVLVVGIVLIVALSQYVTWTPVGTPAVYGLQGRYFIPVAPPLLFLFTSRRLAGSPPARHIPIIATAAAALALSVTILTILSRYYG